MIEPHTMLYINKVKNVSEDLDREMYDLICKEMKKHGFNHYEVSNFSIPGYESRHNLTYWNNNEYYGFGLAASGYVDNLRYTNTVSMGKYLDNDYDGSKEYLDLKDKMVYELILGMRKIKGINIENFNKKYSKNILENKLIQRLIKNGNLEVDDNYIKIPYNKIYIQNEILEELLDYE
jgi:oxygen-independent coproporphyrinogen-3 oxidase